MILDLIWACWAGKVGGAARARALPRLPAAGSPPRPRKPTKPADELADKGPEYIYKVAGIAEEEEEAGAGPSSGGGGGAGGGSQAAADGTIACGICLSPVPAAEFTGMDCGHVFCNGCWREHVRARHCLPLCCVAGAAAGAGGWRAAIARHALLWG